MIREVEAAGAALTVAVSVYVTDKAEAVSLVIPVTKSESVVDSGTVPELVAPEGAPKLTLMVSPVGIAEFNFAVTLAAVVLVDRVHVVELFVALVVGTPGVNELIVNVAGFPEKVISLMVGTVKVTFAVAETDHSFV
ncbi:MAG: hypothetical protein WC222_07935 [Parachlamydiales bacterium]|jgi:hypothetical protein